MNLNRLSIKAQLNIVILLVLLLSFIGSVWVNIINTQSYLTKELTSHAQDTATSLGLALSSPLAEGDKYLIESTVNAIFDRGSYQHITLKNLTGEIIYQREQNNQPEEVPEWFIHTFNLHAPEQQSMVDTGWVIGGVLTVQLHTGIAYEQLWETANDITHVILIIFLFALLFGYLILKQVYKPINAISQQARLLQKREFKLIEPLPRAIELRNFVAAMNHMINSIKRTFEELTEVAEKTRAEAYIDMQTGIENRRSFNDKMESSLSKSMQFHGHLGMLRLSILATVNKECGYQIGDKLLIDAINILKREEKRNGNFKIYRISGSEICFIIENQRNDIIVTIAENIIKQLDEIKPSLKQNYVEKPFSLGLINIKSEDKLSQIMYQIDLETSKSSHVLSGYCLKEDELENATDKESATSLKNKILHILQNPDNTINLKTQSLTTFNQSKLFDAEIFTSFVFAEKAISTAEVFSVAEQFNLSGQLDVVIIKKVLDLLAQRKRHNEMLAMTISHATYKDTASMKKIIAMLKQTQFSKQLVIQIMEQSILADIEKAQAYVKQFFAAGALICINRFGSSIESLRYLIEVRPDYVKLSPNFTINIDKKENNVLLVGAFIRMAHGLNIPIIANCIETHEELELLKELNIDGAMGYIIDRPSVSFSISDS